MKEGTDARLPELIVVGRERSDRMSKTQPAIDSQAKGTVDFFPKGFPEYYHFARHLSKSQQETLFGSLSVAQREKLTLSLNKGGWADVVMRDRLGNFINHVQNEYGYNLIDIRCKALKGKSVYLPRAVWDYVQFELYDFQPKHRQFIVGGVKAVICKQNNDVVLLVREDSQTQE